MNLDFSAKYFPSIVEVHLLIEPRHWQSFIVALEQRLKLLRDTATSLLPLYFSHDVEDFEVRTCYVLDGDPEHLERHVVRDVRSIPGVSATRVRLTLKGAIFAEGLRSLLSGDHQVLSSHIFLKCDPRHDQDIWQALRGLQKADGVYPTWIFRDFYEYDRDVTLRLMGASIASIRQYVERFVSPIPGIARVRLQWMNDLVRIVDSATIHHVAESFMAARLPEST